MLSFLCWFIVLTTMKGFPLWEATFGRCNLGCGYSSSQRLWMHNITLKSVGRSVSSRSDLWLYWAASRGESEIKCPKSNTRYSLLPIKLWQKCSNQPRRYSMNTQWTAVKSWVVKHDCSEMNHVPVHFLNGRLLHHITRWRWFTETHAVKDSISTVRFLIGEQEGYSDSGLKPTIPSLIGSHP